MSRLGIAIALSLLLYACANVPDTAVEAAPRVAQEKPARPLNMPVIAEAPCDCDKVSASLLERGVSALLAGRHVEAISLFQDYKKLRGTPTATWEADIAIAYDSMLSQSPFYDPAAARAAFARLGVAPPDGAPAHPSSLMMRDALATYAALLDSIAELESDNATLAEDLAKREEAIKRLRELTLGQ